MMNAARSMCGWTAPSPARCPIERTHRWAARRSRRWPSRRRRFGPSWRSPTARSALEAEVLDVGGTGLADTQPVELQRPKLRGTDKAFCSRLFGAGVTRTNALESLVISGWVRGLSDRDIEAALAEVLGAEAALSKSTVSRICQGIRVEFETWKTRDLSGVQFDYLLLDGSHFRMHAGAPAEPVAGCVGHRCGRQAGVRGPGTGRLGVH
jgi:hypothetical protein